MKQLRLLSAVVALVLALVLDANASVARQRPPGPSQRPALVVHLHWRLLADDVPVDDGNTVPDVSANGRYAAYTTVSPSLGEQSAAVTLIDERTGRTSSFPGCDTPMLGGQWLLLQCPPLSNVDGLRLIKLSTGQSQEFKISAAADCGPQANHCSPLGIGDYWVKLFATPSSCTEHCTSSYLFQNLYTGRVVPDPSTSGGGTVANLDTPRIAQRVCEPLRAPFYLSGPLDVGSLSFYGRFALAQTPAEALLERCGSRSRLNLTRAPYHAPLQADAELPTIAGNQRALLWQTYAHPGEPMAQLNGLLLPIQRRTTIPISHSIRSPAFAGVTNRTVYVFGNLSPLIGSLGTVWAATLPSDLR